MIWIVRMLLTVLYLFIGTILLGFMVRICKKLGLISLDTISDLKNDDTGAGCILIVILVALWPITFIFFVIALMIYLLITLLEWASGKDEE